MSVSSLLNAANTICPTLSFQRPRTIRLVGARQRQPDRAYVVRGDHAPDASPRGDGVASVSVE